MRPIDADALKKDLGEALMTLMKSSEISRCEKAGFALDVVDSAETLDVVPVVRCKDCFYAEKMPDRGMPKFGADALNCTACRGDDGYGFYGISVVWPDDYCSNGAKMEGEK